MIASLARRDLATRRASWAGHLASALHRAGVGPNAVSVAGGGFGLAALAAFTCASRVAPTCRVIFLLTAAAAIQLRLLCNLLDGVLAVEKGLKTPTGELFNEIPDRLADVAILVGAGYFQSGIPGSAALGWAAAATALFTAYVRVLGGALGLTQDFVGPMAKQHRMFVLTLVALLSAGQIACGRRPAALPIGLAIITAGGVVTAWRRVTRLAAELEAA